MPRWLQALLIVCAVLVLLCAGALWASVYFWQKHGRGFVESGQETFRDGQEFGRRADSRGCLTEAVERHRRAASFNELFRTNLFLRGCLDAAAPTPGFCDGVPGQLEFVKTGQWVNEECRRHGLSLERQCQQLFGQVQQHCARRAAQTP